MELIDIDGDSLVVSDAWLGDKEDYIELEIVYPDGHWAAHMSREGVKLLWQHLGVLLGENQ